VERCERTITMSVTPWLEAGENERATMSSARCESGWFVGAPSVVSRPPSRSPMHANAATSKPIQAPIVRHGRLAQARAIPSVDSFIEPIPLLLVPGP
jgi:hypothetical protein